MIDTKAKIRTVGKSWVIRLPKSFTDKNKIEAGTHVLLTVRNGTAVKAEMVPPLSEEIATIADRLISKRKSAFEELKRIGD